MSKEVVLEAFVGLIFVSTFVTVVSIYFVYEVRNTVALVFQ